MGKITDKFWEDEIMAITQLTILSQNLCCKQKKQHRVIDASFRLHGKLQAEKYSTVFPWNPWNVLMRMYRKKKRGEILYIADRADQFTTSA